MALTQSASEWEEQYRRAEVLVEFALAGRNAMRKTGAAARPEDFRLHLAGVIPRIVGSLTKNEISYEDAEGAVTQFAADFPPHDYDYAIDSFHKAITRRADENIRITAEIREKCGPMIVAGINPEKIRAAAHSINKFGTISEADVTEILRHEWRKLKNG
jgi:hypothetical protein